MAGNPRLKALDQQITERGGVDWVLEEIREGKTFSALTLDLGCSKFQFDRWRRKLPHDQQKEISQARADAAVDLAETVVMEADSPSAMSVAREQARLKQWVASRVDRESWGEDKPQAVTLNVHTLHLAALQAQKPPTIIPPIPEAEVLSIEESTG